MAQVVKLQHVKKAEKNPLSFHALLPFLQGPKWTSSQAL